MRWNPGSAFGFAGRALIWPVPVPPDEERHGPHPDHLGPAVHQRHQAPGQPGRARCCRPTSTPASSAPRATRCSTSAPPTSTARPAELAAAAAGQDVAHLLRRAARAPARRRPRPSACRWDWFGRSSSPQNHRLTQHFAEVLEEQRPDRGARRPDGLFDRRRAASCPTATSRGPARTAAIDKARGDQCDNCGRLLDPTDLIDPYSAISGSRNLEVRDTRHLYLLQTKLSRPIRAWVDIQGRLADAWPARSPTSTWTRA